MSYDDDGIKLDALSILASEMAQTAKRFPRLGLEDEKPITFYERAWGDTTLLLVLRHQGWLLSIRRVDCPPTVAQVNAAKKAFSVPEYCYEEKLTRSLNSKTYYITRLTWKSQKEVKTDVGQTNQPALRLLF